MVKYNIIIFLGRLYKNKSRKELSKMKNLKVVTKMSLIGLIVLAFVTFSVLFSIESMNAIEQ
ncbi:MAG TPA: hypothetical protein DDY31_18325, partial [Lachnospiraceae bacterium]|nr:hypothetical protein [Lachnospiraceae bacterium]